MQNFVQNSRKIPLQKVGDKEMLHKNMVLSKIGEMLLHQGLLTLKEKKDFDRMAQERL